MHEKTGATTHGTAMVDTTQTHTWNFIVSLLHRHLMPVICAYISWNDIVLECELKIETDHTPQPSID